MEDGSRWAGRLSWTWDACSMVVRTAGAGLRRLAEVAVMQATDFGNLHDPARLGELDGPEVRRILVEREMRASPVIVGEVAGQNAAQVAFAENQNVSRRRRSRRVTIEPEFSLDQPSQINHLVPDGFLAKDRTRSEGLQANEQGCRPGCSSRLDYATRLSVTCLSGTLVQSPWSRRCTRRRQSYDYNSGLRVSRR